MTLLHNKYRKLLKNLEKGDIITLYYHNSLKDIFKNIDTSIIKPLYDKYKKNLPYPGIKGNTYVVDKEVSNNKMSCKLRCYKLRLIGDKKNNYITNWLLLSNGDIIELEGFGIINSLGKVKYISHINNVNEDTLEPLNKNDSNSDSSFEDMIDDYSESSEESYDYIDEEKSNSD